MEQNKDDCVKGDVKSLGMSKEHAQSWNKWKGKSRGNWLTEHVSRAGTKSGEWERSGEQTFQKTLEREQSMEWEAAK